MPDSENPSALAKIQRDLRDLYFKDHPRGDPARERVYEDVEEFLRRCRDAWARAKAETKAEALAEDRSKIIKGGTRRKARVVPAPDLRGMAERDRQLQAEALRRFEASLSKDDLRKLQKIGVSVEEFIRILEMRDEEPPADK